MKTKNLLASRVLIGIVAAVITKILIKNDYEEFLF